MTANLTADKFASTVFDYIVVGGGTAGLVVAARYVGISCVEVGETLTRVRVLQTLRGPSGQGWCARSWRLGARLASDQHPG